MEYQLALDQDDSWREINLDKVCRTCLEESNTMKSLFTNDEYFGNISIGSLVALCTQLTVMEHDDLPQLICAECIRSITTSITFKQRAERADAKLRGYIKMKRRGSAAQGDHIKQELQPDTKDPMAIGDLSHHFDSPNDNYDAAIYSYDSEDDSPLSLLANSNPVRGVAPYLDCSALRSPRSKPSYFQCSKCHRAFSSANYLKRHEAIIHSDIQIDNDNEVPPNCLVRCKLCSLTFASKELASSHLRLSHVESDGGTPALALAMTDILETIKVEAEFPEESPVEGIRDIPPTRMHDGDRFFCDICLKSFQSFDHYQKHTDNHFQNQPTCRICDKSYSRMVSLRRHLKKHSSLDKLVCADFDNKLSLLADHEKVASIRREDLTDEALSDIIIQDIQEGRYWRYIVEPKSEIVDLELKKSQYLKGTHRSGLSESEEKLRRSRMKSRPVRLHKCSVCDKVFTRTNHIIRHMKTHDYVFPHKCDKCCKVFANGTLLDKHKRLLCKFLARPHECGECVLKFIDKKSLQRHIGKVHASGDEPLVPAPPQKEAKAKPILNCPQCGKAFKTQRYLDRHLITHMTDKLECPVCQKVFKLKDNLRCHMRIHKPKREGSLNKYLCVYCGRSFSCSSNFGIHLRRHTGEKPYKCDVCDKAFPRSCDLSCHKKMHTGEKPCICTVCGKAFSRSNKLVRHMRIHTGHRPYKCTYCDKTFTQTNDLTLHTRRHTGEKPYACDVCGDSFIQGTALRVHRRKAGHPERGADAPLAASPLFAKRNKERSMHREQ